MASSELDEIQPYRNISAKAYEHPADRAATAALKAIPVLDTVVRRLLEWRYERALRQFYLGNAVRIGETQLPELWSSHRHVSRILDMPDLGDLYVAPNVLGGGVVIGTKRPLMVIDSLLLTRLGPGEQRALIAHEAGHVLSDHLVYMTVLNIILSAGGSIPMIGLPLRAVGTVLLEWYRAAELSCDRAATLAVRDPQIICRLLMVTAGGMPASDLNLDAFLTQAMEYQNWDDPSDRARRFFNELGRTHANAVKRVSEVMAWVQSGEYDRIVRGEFRTRDQADDVREEAGSAIEYYTERFKAILAEASENLTNLGAQAGDLGAQVADWVRNRRGGPPTDG